MHGEMFKARCELCAGVHVWREDLALETECPSCQSSGGMRPHVVWFGEMPFDMERISEALARCRLFLSIGTSGSVYPAAGFVQEAIFRARAHTVELNLEPSEGATFFAEQHYGPATQVVPRYVEKLLAEGW
jgi:NAD-dependent deacetylase